ncbi:ABC transporter substrate-binding protein [Lignipirellula cremea]|uniref:Oligopeptide-binding protein AppA n=1 Tax=Lignipirellula cremea TaxID=2528010 RepID=A0A518E1D0_9BACT|nr:ABC transporter substrate-binding protein [Lignipirellula cremea]QDU97900.1 Oligopeptide-binding protein AppA precursor [Lignipirellula cremea]
MFSRMTLVARTFAVLAAATMLITGIGCGGNSGSGTGSTTPTPGGSTASSSSGTDTPAGTETSTGAATSDTTAEAPPESKYKIHETDVLLLSYPDDPNTINLLTSNDSVSTAFQRFVYETFATQDMSDPKVWEPRLAESWEFDEENLEYTFHLRKGVLWHPITYPDGTVVKDVEFTAADVEFSFDCLMNKFVEAAPLRSYYTDPDPETGEQIPRITMTVVDDYTVKVKWAKPYMMADEFTLGSLPILPQHVYSLDEGRQLISLDFTSKEFGDAFNQHWANLTMCGTGPLIFGTWDKGEQVTLRRNDQYWGDEFPFSEVVYQYITNEETLRQKGLQGKLDWTSFRQVDHYVAAKEHPNVKDGKVKLVDYPTTGYRFMGYNQEREIFRDKKVRWAMSHATPVDQIIRDIYQGYAQRVTGPFAPSSPFYDKSLQPVEFNIEKAKQLMREAGWEDTNANGVVDKEINGKRVEFEFDLMIFADSQTYASIGQLIQSEFRKIGIKVQITPAKWALMLEKLNAKEFDATILGWAANWRSDPYQIWHGSQADVEKSSNNIGYRNPKVDKLIEELQVTVNEKKQIELYQQIHQLIYEDQPYTFLYSDDGLAAYDGRLEDVRTYEGLRPFIDMSEWRSSQPRLSTGE